MQKHGPETDMSNKKLKPDVNQLPLTKFVKSHANLEIKQSENEDEDITTKELNVATEEISSKKRKNPCEGTSPKDKISPPHKKINPNEDPNTFNMSEEEYKKMENNLHTKLTASLTTSLSESLSKSLKDSLKEDMKNMIDSSLAGAIESMNNASARMTESSNLMSKQGEAISELQEENKKLNRRLFNLETTNKKLTSKITAIENRSLENNLIIKGIADEKWEKEGTSVAKVYREISATIEADDQEKRMTAIKTMGIRRCRRLGKYEDGKCRPLSVEFSLKQDTEYVFENKNSLREGIYIDREYPIEIEYQRKVLRPILQAARKLPAFKKKCKLEGATLHLKGKPYTLKTLHKLPKELNAFKISSKTDDTTVGFFGQLNPLSNFYDAPFKHEGILFHSSEQWIQYQKAIFAKDIESCNKILASKTAIECKILANQISEVDVDAWNEVAKQRCMPGIVCKFRQNPRVMESLLNTGDKIIVECAKDKVWGTGWPLASEHCLDQVRWHSQGILGEILCEIRADERTRRQGNENTPMVT